MARHEGRVEVDDAGALVFRCGCGWRRPLGAEVTGEELSDAMGQHHRELRGPPFWQAYVRFGWDDDAPLP